MPPEKMFELMRSMKETVNNNPQMARQLLIENPQLAYALLQVFSENLFCGFRLVLGLKVILRAFSCFRFIAS